MDKIVIKGLKIFAHHGVLPEERRNGQMFVIDIALTAGLGVARRSDRIADTVNYVDVARTIHRVMTEEDDDLIERVAERILRNLFAEQPLVDAIDLSIRKPDAPMPFDLDYAGVEISMRRNEL